MLRWKMKNHCIPLVMYAHPTVIYSFLLLAFRCMIFTILFRIFPFFFAVEKWWCIDMAREETLNVINYTFTASIGWDARCEKKLNLDNVFLRTDQRFNKNGILRWSNMLSQVSSHVISFRLRSISISHEKNFPDENIISLNISPLPWYTLKPKYSWNEAH